VGKKTVVKAERGSLVVCAGVLEVMAVSGNVLSGESQEAVGTFKYLQTDL
jgi:hypothetical protein